MEQNENTGEKWLFIVNPAAGGGIVGKRWSEAERQLKAANISFDAIFTEKKLHATLLAKQAIEQGCRKLVAVGGDGTGNEVVNGILLQTVCPPEQVAFTIFPSGTGNDWIKMHRIPAKTRLWIKYFQKAVPSIQDVGWLSYQKDSVEHRRYFFNVAGLSYDAYVARRSESRKGKMSSKIVYLFFIFRCLFEFKIPRIRLCFDGQTVDKRLYTVNVGICRYSGGGLQLVPQALPHDGKLALTFVERIPKLAVLLITPLIYLGKIGWHPAVHLHQVEEVFVDSSGQEFVLVEADGEFLGNTPVQMGILKAKLKILIPGG